ncbi:MAG: metallophosphoesterase [Anaerolineaceae bacterium]|nr:metallophosphoesterase [Anaerolineaceae bacterium]MDE0609109.1 metallophosphoesterase [Anaerolineaceae bacterium]
MQPLTFVHISDSHVLTDPSRRGWERGPSLPGASALVREIETLPAPVDFVLHTGDVVHDPEREEEYQQALELYRRLSVPVYFLPGNHDRSRWLQRALRGVEDPGPHADREFEAGGVQFLLLDSSVADANHNEGHGQLAPEQLAWLEGRCAAPDSRPLVVALHHHPLAIDVPWLDDLVLRNGEALHEILLLARGRLRCVLYGHIHESLLTLRDGIAYQSVRGSWFQNRTWPGQETEFPEPIQWPGYNLVTLTERDTFIRHCRVRR